MPSASVPSPHVSASAAITGASSASSDLARSVAYITAELSEISKIIKGLNSSRVRLETVMGTSSQLDLRKSLTPILGSPSLELPLRWAQVGELSDEEQKALSKQYLAWSKPTVHKFVEAGLNHASGVESVRESLVKALEGRLEDMVDDPLAEDIKKEQFESYQLV